VVHKSLMGVGVVFVCFYQNFVVSLVDNIEYLIIVSI